MCALCLNMNLTTLKVLVRPFYVQFPESLRLLKTHCSADSLELLETP